MKEVHKEVISFLKEMEKNAKRMRLCLERKGPDYV
jgi:predicted unusual protein kinase regulating ubiquinone biosynthesis (AarF/ABC1/UbiB family)